MKTNFMSSNKLNRIFLNALVLGFGGLLSCTNVPKVTDYPNDADPSTELARVEADMQTSVQQQVEVISPTSFGEAKSYLEEARTGRNKNQNQSKILHNIAVSRAYLQKANDVSKESSQMLPGVLIQRKNAILAGATVHFAKDFERTDKTLKSLTAALETKNNEPILKNRDAVEKQYADLEVSSIVFTKIGPAKAIVEQAKKEGGKTMSPTTLVWAEKRIEADEAIIRNNPHNVSEIDRAEIDANEASKRLIGITRQAKSSAGQSPEQIATNMEHREISANAEAAMAEKKLQNSEENLVKNEVKLKNEASKLETASENLAKLKEKSFLEDEYVAARKLFTEDEAEVSRKGDALLIRLKGLQFAQNSSDLNSSNYGLLSKIGKLLTDKESVFVSIEGHSDSIGSSKGNTALSLARADSVKNYMTDQNYIDHKKIEAKGFGDSRPLSTNKTKMGRAQNRRVDVLITNTTL